MTISTTCDRHLWAQIEGVLIYRVYRHGKPKDVFLSFWLSTNPAIEECSPYQFDVRDLRQEARNDGDVLSSFKGRNGTYEAGGEAYLRESALLIANAIAAGEITAPPAPPGAKQAGFKFAHESSEAIAPESKPTKYRYTAQNRTIDDGDTKQFRKKLRSLTLEIVSFNGAMAICRGDNGEYFTQVPIWHLKPIAGEGAE